MFNKAYIEQRIKQAIDNNDILSAAIAIVKGEEIIYADGFGRTSIEDPALPVTTDTLHLIGLTSRTITTTMVLRLVEQGVLELDRPIVDYLPGYVFHANPEYGRKLTLHHLLSETSGLAAGGRGWGPNNPQELRRFVWEEFAHFSFLVEPGTLPEHGNNPVLVGHIAEAATGTYFGELVQALVLDPLEMQRTIYDRAVAMTYPLALPHRRDKDGKFQVIHRYPDNLMGNPDFYGISTANDLANLAIMLLNEGRFQGEQFLTVETVQMMGTEQANYRNNAASDIRSRMETGEALGLITGTYKGIPCLGRPTAVHGMVVAFDLFPEQDLGVVCLTNPGRWPDFTMLFDIYDHLLDQPGDFQYPQPETPPDESHQRLWPQFEGDYFNSWGDLISIQMRDGQLTLENDGQTQDLVAVSEEEYYALDDRGDREPVTFIVEDTGPTQIVMRYNGPYARIDRDPDFEPDPSVWAAYQGLYVHYHGINFIAGIYIFIEDDTLYLLDVNKPEQAVPSEAGRIACQPLSQTRFFGDFGRLDFIKNEGDAVEMLIRDGAFRYWRVDA